MPTYYMARYPVTVAQFRAFVQAKEYELVDGRCLQGVDTHPVVYVTWQDAAAYSRWLTERLRAWKHTPEPLAMLLREQKWEIRLPSEAEWEKAARGAQDARVFPWGDDLDPNRANYEMKIGSTSTVGGFPGGASPYGIEELSGNVLEWTSTQWHKNYGEGYQSDLPVASSAVLRGGSFGDSEWGVRCAYRFGLGPDYRDHSIGFRVVVGVPH